MTTVTAHEVKTGDSPAETPIRVLFALPGLHQVNRGAEVAFESIAQELAQLPGFEVILVGSGKARDGTHYKFRHAGAISRRRFRKVPGMPLFRTETMCEEFTFVPGLWRAYKPREVDITVTCSYPYTNWLLRYRRRAGGAPLHVFVTQNGDWALRAGNREYRYFGCDGLVCTNPEYLEAYRNRWNCALIPNGVDPGVFEPGPAERARFGIPAGKRVVLTVSALIPSKHVIEGMRAVAELPDVVHVVAGDGPLRDQVVAAGKELLGERFRHVMLDRTEMPALYRSCDVLLHMSQGEPSAVSYIEALASGLPVVAHANAVTRWTFDGQACLVDTNDQAAVVGALGEAFARRGPVQSAACRDVAVKRFSWAAIAVSYGEFFRAMLKSSSHSRRAK